MGLEVEVAHHQGENIEPRAFDVTLSMDEPKEPKDMAFSPTLRSFVLVLVSYVGIVVGRVWN
jgi:hypothetical protein